MYNRPEIDQFLVKLIYENDVNSLQKQFSSLSYNALKQLSSAQYSLLNLPDFQSGQTRSGRLSDKNLTLLHIAAFYDSTESFFYLVELFKTMSQNENEILYARTPEGYYPLHYALINQSYEIATFIISRASDQIYNVGEGVRYFPITLAVIGGMTEFLEYLFKITSNNPLPKVQIDQAYEMALGIGEYPCLKLLIENKNQDNAKLRGNEETIQMKAASNCSPEVVSLVLKNEHENFDRIFMKNGEADSLLKRLLTVDPPKFKEQIKYVLELMSLDGQKIDPDKNHPCKGVCHWMCYFCDVEIAQIIIDDNFAFDIDRVDEKFQTGPFMMKRDDLTEKQMIDMLQFLIDHGFKLNYKAMVNNRLKQKTLLEHFVTSKKRLNVVRFLLEKGADPDVPTFIQGGAFGTIREYVKKKKGQDMNDIFDQFPPHQ